MSRAERRQYERMSKGQDPYAPNPRQSRDPRRNKPRPRPAANAKPATGGRQFWTRSVGAAVIIGVLAFSVAWGQGMPIAAYVGVGAAGATVLAAAGLRRLLARVGDRRPPA
jgi:hypothetical protein